jgi:hypothetical protein
VEWKAKGKSEEKKSFPTQLLVAQAFAEVTRGLGRGRKRIGGRGLPKVVGNGNIGWDGWSDFEGLTPPVEHGTESCEPVKAEDDLFYMSKVGGER